MNSDDFKEKVESSQVSTYKSQFNGFWKWKLEVERHATNHILDDNHRELTCQKLLKILPGWQTYRGVDCDPAKYLPIAIERIRTYYNQLRHFTLLNFNEVPKNILREIWHELGSVKGQSALMGSAGEYYVIAVCKPLMLLWGQTLGFDGINRKNLRKDTSFTSCHKVPGARWNFEQWHSALLYFQNELLNNPDIISFCEIKSEEDGVFGSKYIVPFGRFIDTYYFDKKTSLT